MKDDDALELLWAAHFEELRNMSDADILDGVDIPKLGSDRIQMMASVKAEAGRRRLAAAKTELTKAKGIQAAEGASVSLTEMRAFLKNVASNDPRFTLAARALEEMTDDVVLHTYARIKALLADD
jgi:hypothetical protein